MGPACRALHAQVVTDLACQRIQADEAWAFVYARRRNVPPDMKGSGAGDVWIWTALCADTKVVPAWHVGHRTWTDAVALYEMLNAAVPHKFELNTDGHNSYWAALTRLNEIPDYAKVIKTYATPSGLWDSRENKYQQPRLRSIDKVRVCGNPDVERASTSFAERMNLGIRMSVGKMARLSNKHAKRIAMLDAHMSIYYTHYNLCRAHQTLGGMTPAMVNRLTDHRWSAAELVEAAYATVASN
jgi:IS1 family transposase